MVDYKTTPIICQNPKVVVVCNVAVDYICIGIFKKYPISVVIYDVAVDYISIGIFKNYPTGTVAVDLTANYIEVGIIKGNPAVVVVCDVAVDYIDFRDAPRINSITIIVFIIAIVMNLTVCNFDRRDVLAVHSIVIGICNSEPGQCRAVAVIKINRIGFTIIRAVDDCGFDDIPIVLIGALERYGLCGIYDVLVIYGRCGGENIVIIRIINRILYGELEGLLRFIIDDSYRMRYAAVIEVICLSEPAVFTFAPNPYNAVGVNSKAVPESCGK